MVDQGHCSENGAAESPHSAGKDCQQEHDNVRKATRNPKTSNSSARSTKPMAGGNSFCLTNQLRDGWTEGRKGGRMGGRKGKRMGRYMREQKSYRTGSVRVPRAHGDFGSILLG